METQGGSGPLPGWTLPNANGQCTASGDRPPVGRAAHESPEERVTLERATQWRYIPCRRSSRRLVNDQHRFVGSDRRVFSRYADRILGGI